MGMVLVTMELLRRADLFMTSTPPRDRSTTASRDRARRNNFTPHLYRSGDLVAVKKIVGVNVTLRFISVKQSFALLSEGSRKVPCYPPTASIIFSIICNDLMTPRRPLSSVLHICSAVRA